MKPVFDLARELHEKLGGEYAGLKPIPKPAAIEAQPMRLNPKLWPASIFEEDDNASL